MTTSENPRSTDWADGPHSVIRLDELDIDLGETEMYEETVDAPPVNEDGDDGSVSSSTARERAAAVNSDDADAAGTGEARPGTGATSELLDAWRAWDLDIDIRAMPQADLEQRLIDVITLEQPVTGARLQRIAGRSVRGSSAAARNGQVRLTEAILALVGTPGVRTIREGDDDTFELGSLVFALDGWAPGTARQLGPRTAVDVPLIELRSIIERTRAKFTAMTRAECMDFVVRKLLNSTRTAAMRSRFDRAYIGDVGMWSDGRDIVTTEPSPLPKVNGARHSASFDIAVAAGDVVARAARGRELIESDDVVDRRDGAMLLRDAALNGELRAVDVMLARASKVFSGGPSGDYEHWIRVAAAHGNHAAMKHLLLRDDDTRSSPRFDAYRYVIDQQAGGEPVNTRDLSNAVAREVMRVRGLQERELLRRSRLVPLKDVREAWDWSMCSDVVEAARARLRTNGDAPLLAEQVLPARALGSADALVQCATHLASVGIELVPDPRFEHVVARSGDMIMLRDVASPSLGGAAYRRAALAVRVMVGVAEADGRVHVSERRLILEHVEVAAGLRRAERDRLHRYVQTLLAAPEIVAVPLTDVAQLMSPRVRLDLFELIGRVASVDGAFHHLEQGFLERAAAILEIDSVTLAATIDAVRHDTSA